MFDIYLNEVLSLAEIFEAKAMTRMESGMELLMKTISSGVVPFELDTNSS